jgi:hypothetical protein
MTSGLYVHNNKEACYLLSTTLNILSKKEIISTSFHKLKLNQKKINFSAASSIRAMDENINNPAMVESLDQRIMLTP